MTSQEFSALVMRIDNSLRDWDKDKEYMKDSHIKDDGTYCIMGRHLDFIAKIDKDTKESELPRLINNALVDRFNMNRAYYVAPSENDARIRFGGMYHSDRRASKLVFESVNRKYADIHKQIDFEISWILARFYNVNDVNLSNILENLWYEHRGTLNEQIQKYIMGKVNELAELGKINVW